MYAEFVGLTPKVIGLIERHRVSPDETKSEILERLLSGLRRPDPTDRSSPSYFDFGQGVKLPVGEKLLLFLSNRAKQGKEPDAVAEIHADGFYLRGKKIAPSRGSVLDPAMKTVQKEKRHYNEKGQIVSLSAWRQWHVLRDGRLVSVAELKDPALAHRRGRHNRKALTAEELGL